MPDGKRSSLMDEAGIKDVPASNGKASGGAAAASADKIKIGVAIGVIVLAAGWMAYYFEIFGGSKPAADATTEVHATPEEKAENQRILEERKEQEERAIQRGVERASSG